MIDAEHAPWTQVAAHLREARTARASRARGLAVLPFGALEQHGAHLPLSTDTVQAAHIARGVAERLDAVLLPAIAYGDTWSNAGFPGTVSLSTDTVSAIARDIGRALSQGPEPATGLVIVNGDWGNRMPLAHAARDLVASGTLPTIVLDYPGLAEAADELRTTPPVGGGLLHADEIETSMMLALAPALVGEAREACYPDLPSDFGAAPHQLHRLSRTGVFGDPRPASAARGRAILGRVIEASMAVLEDFIRRLEHDGAPPPPG